MKKSRLFSLLLALTLIAGLTPSAASAAADPSEPYASEEDSSAISYAPSVATASVSEILAGMHVEAKAAILIDADNNVVLYEQDSHARLYPASITKVMTTLLTLEAVDRGELSLDQVVTASGNLYNGIGADGSTADLKEGEEIRIIDLLYCVLLPSANEACNVLAEVVAGDISSFVNLMNQRAAELGMEDTHFANTHGYHDDDHYTSAYDIALMCGEAIKHETFRTITATLNYTLPATNAHEQRVTSNTNSLLSSASVYRYEYATGIKTGSTPEAGYCLASSAEKGGRRLIAVVLGAENPAGEDGIRLRLQFSESARLLKWGFDNFTYQTLLDSNKLDIAEVEVTLSEQANYVAVRPEGELSAVLPNDMALETFTFTPVLDAESVEAPVEEGQVLGSITVSYEGLDYGTLPLVANAGVERSELLYRLDRIQKFFDQLWVKIALVAAAVLIAALVLRRLLFGKRRASRGRGGYAYSGGSRYNGRRRR